MKTTPIIPINVKSVVSSWEKKSPKTIIAQYERLDVAQFVIYLLNKVGFNSTITRIQEDYSNVGIDYKPKYGIQVPLNQKKYAELALDIACEFNWSSNRPSNTEIEKYVAEINKRFDNGI